MRPDFSRFQWWEAPFVARLCLLVLPLAWGHAIYEARQASQPQVWTQGPPPGSVSRAERHARRDPKCNTCHTEAVCESCDGKPPVWEIR